MADEPRPLAVQIWDNDPVKLAAVGRRLVEEFHVSVVDVNFGCPVRNISDKAHSGSYLLRYPDRVGQIVAQVAGECRPVPVTAKIRLGAMRDTINAIDVAQAVEAAGGAALTVHGRTAEDLFRGTADWEEIARVKPHLSRIPLIGNGDLKTPAAVVEAFARYAVDGVMIGRAGLGRPWLFAQAAAALAGESIPPDPTLAEQRQLLVDHYRMVVERFGTVKGTMLMRAYACCYGQGERGARFPPRNRPRADAGGVRGGGRAGFSPAVNRTIGWHGHPARVLARHWRDASATRDYLFCSSKLYRRRLPPRTEGFSSRGNRRLPVWLRQAAADHFLGGRQFRNRLQPAQGSHRNGKRQLRQVAVLPQEMIGNQKLRERQRRAVARLATILVRPHLVVTYRMQVGEMLPNGFLQVGGVLGGHVAVDLQEVDGAPLIASQVQPYARRRGVLAVHQIGQVRMRNRGAQDQRTLRLGPAASGELSSRGQKRTTISALSRWGRMNSRESPSRRSNSSSTCAAV